MQVYVLPTLFGLEGLCAEQLRRLKIPSVKAEDGRVYFEGTADHAATALVNSSMAERVCILCGEFSAVTFEELFEGVFSVDWAALIPANARFPVRGHCLSSQLMSVQDCRAIIKKAVVEKLRKTYKVTTFPEDGDVFMLRFNILKNRVQVMLDITGDSLHKRAYRPVSGTAPLRETLAAGMVELSKFVGNTAFCDPFCGSGTLVIEAAMKARGRAVGQGRGFAFEHMPNGAAAVKRARVAAEAREMEVSRRFSGRDYEIVGSDIDPEMIAIAKQSAERAGVSDLVRFEVRDALEGAERASGRGVIVCNPPYGERMGERDAACALLRDYGKALKAQDFSGWTLHIISPEPELEKLMGMRAVKKRKLYNGTIKCDLYSFGL